MQTKDKTLSLSLKNCVITLTLERITDGKVESKAILESCHIVVARLAGFVWQVDADAEVKTHDNHAHVEAHTESGAECQLTKEI